MKLISNFILRITTIFLILLFSLQSLTKADDIKDLEIEGVSIGETLLEYYTKQEINKKSEFVYRGGKEFNEYSKIKIKNNLNSYETLAIYYKTNDQEFLIKGIAGRKYYKYNISKCYDKQKTIAREIEDILLNSKKIDIPKRKLKSYPNGKSYITSIFFRLSSGGLIGIQCYDMSPEDNPNNIDRLSVVIFTDEYNSWLSTNKF